MVFAAQSPYPGWQNIAVSRTSDDRPLNIFADLWNKTYLTAKNQ
jgi:hypothetical protein